MDGTERQIRLRRASVLFGCCVLALVGIFAAAAARDTAQTDKSSAEPVTKFTIPVTASDPEELEVTPVAAAVPPAYILREYGGVIAVYREGSRTPELVTGIRVDTLPRFDRERLVEGLYVETNAELLLLLEDFGS